MKKHFQTLSFCLFSIFSLCISDLALAQQKKAPSPSGHIRVIGRDKNLSNDCIDALDYNGTLEVTISLHLPPGSTGNLPIGCHVPLHVAAFVVGDADPVGVSDAITSFEPSTEVVSCTGAEEDLDHIEQECGKIFETNVQIPISLSKYCYTVGDCLDFGLYYQLVTPYDGGGWISFFLRANNESCTNIIFPEGCFCQLDESPSSSQEIKVICNNWVKPIFPKEDLSGGHLPSNLAIGQATIQSDLTKERKLQNVYPNPVTNELFIQFQEQQGAQIRVLIRDASGQKVSSEKEVVITDDTTISFEVSDLPSGVYFFQIINGKETYTRKIVKTE